MTITRGLPPECKPGQPVALDVELFGAEKARLHRPTGTFACLSVAMDGKAWVVDDVHDVQPVLGRLAKGLWVIQNATFDLKQLERWAKLPRVRIWDTMLVDQDLFGGYYTTFSLEDLARRWLNTYLDKDARELFNDATKMTRQMRAYTGADALTTLVVQGSQATYMKENDENLKCYFDIDELMLHTVMAMQPVHIDVDAWLEYAANSEATGQKLEADLGFNVKSPKQVMEVLRKSGFSSIKSSDEATIKACLTKARSDKQRELLNGIMTARMHRDAFSKYGAAWVEKNVEEGGLVYANWRIVGAETGRMSCRNPNLQQIPTRELPIFRSFFVASRGNSLVISDVKQQEPRIAAHFSQDPQLIKDVLTGDVYAPVAKAFGIERDPAKTVFLGATYGLSKYGLSTRLSISQDAAEGFLLSLFKRYKVHSNWINRQRLGAARIGYVRTVMGRRNFMNPHNYQWENNAINAPIQGTAAEMTKMALNIMCKNMEQEFGRFYGIMCIHDEVVCDVPKGEMRWVKKIIKDAWIEAGEQMTPGLPTAIDMFTGPNWACKKGEAENDETYL